LYAAVPAVGTVFSVATVGSVDPTQIT